MHSQVRWVDDVLELINPQPAARIAELQRRVDSTAHPCGCKSGAVVSTLALVGWPVFKAASGLPTTVTGIGRAVLTYAAIVIAAGAVGKLAGIVAGRWQHRHLRRVLQRASSQGA